jgi:hypothetical protein
MANKSILLYGDSGDGKSTLLGEFAEYIFKTTKKKTRLYSADRGGVETIRPYIDLGIIELVQLDGDPWIWINSAVKGKIKENNKWINGVREDIGFYAYEGMTSMADELMSSLAQKAGQGVNIGGSANVSFKANDSGESLTISGNNMSHYNVTQMRIVEEVWQSQRLPGWVAWTAAVKRDEDPNAAGKILGPAVAGKALTAEVPRWFTYSFRVSAIPAVGSGKERHILYMGDHTDVSSGNSKGLGNTRNPLDAPALPGTIEPASLVKAIELINAGYQPALEAIKKRLGIVNSK